MSDLPGTFIVIEGPDGSGTTSQATYLADRFESENLDVRRTCQPSGGELGKIIRRHLKGTEAPVDHKLLALLFAADRIEHLSSTIEPVLRRGGIVISDRYVFSSWVYQSLNCEADWVVSLNKYARWPDLTLILDVPVDVAQARLRARAQATGKGPEIYDDVVTQGRVAAAYGAILNQGLKNVRRIDGNRDFDEVCLDTYRACNEVVDAR